MLPMPISHMPLKAIRICTCPVHYGMRLLLASLASQILRSVFDDANQFVSIQWPTRFLFCSFHRLSDLMFAIEQQSIIWLTWHLWLRMGFGRDRRIRAGSFHLHLLNCVPNARRHSFEGVTRPEQLDELITTTIWIVAKCFTEATGNAKS